MPTSAQSLIQMVNKLRQERSGHVAAVEEIDRALTGLGISLKPSKRRGRPKGSRNKPKRRRQRFSQTATEFVLGMMGKKGLTSAQVNAKWKESGRKGVANNTLTALVKEGKLKRKSVKGQRGGVYLRA